MTRKLKKYLLFSTILFSLLVVSCNYSFLVSPVYAADETVTENGLIILNDVVGLNISNYVVTTKETPQNYNSSFLGVVPQKDVIYELTSEENKVTALYTFTDSRLQMIHILENEGTPHVNKAAANSIELAKNFLTNYQAYAADSLYGELNSTLDNVEVGENVTKTSGNTQLEVITSNGYTTFKWTYTINNVVAPSKSVALGFKDGFLTYFVNNWQLYNIGSTNVTLSKEDAEAIALETAKNYASITLDAYAFEAQNLNASNIRWESLIFDCSLGASSSRSEDPLMLYPVWRVGVALDKWYGQFYGIAVDVWADTKEVRCIQEAWSTLPPPEGVPMADLDAVGVETSYFSTVDTVSTLNSQASVVGAEPNLIMYIVRPTFSVTTIIAISIWVHKKKKSQSYNLPKLRSLRTGGLLFCVLILSIALLAPIATVSATTRAGVIWGSESSGAIDPETGESWRKNQIEIELQNSIAATITSYFGQGGYAGFDRQGDPGSMKNSILTYITSLSTSYDCLAVVDFDHGMGRDDYSGDNGTFHFMFEDNTGTIVGEPGREGVDWDYVPENGVYDMDIYSNLTDPSKVAFAFINACGSANLTNLMTGQQNWQGLVNNKACGMPFAWTGRTVVDKDAAGFTVSLNMSIDGYSEPDDGPQCYIGFPFGSASLMQRVPYDNGSQYYVWVDRFFDYALRYDMSVNIALDHASLQTWSEPFGSCPLMNFTCYWWNANPETVPDCSMAVYGNGNIKLRYYTPGWNDNFNDNYTDPSKWEKLQVNGATASETTGQLTVTVPSGSGIAQAGYVTKNYYNIKDCKASIKVSEFNSLDEMVLQICTTKTTASDPYYQNNWYRILKARYDSKIYVQTKINGVLSTKLAAAWTGATGNLTFDICDGSIAFYENGNMRYSEPYALASYNCYIYMFTSTDRSRANGTDKFDDFALAPTPSFWDYFEDVNNYYGWTVDWGAWQVQNGKLSTTQSHSMIHTDAEFSMNRHVRADVKTVAAGAENGR